MTVSLKNYSRLLAMLFASGLGLLNLQPAHAAAVATTTDSGRTMTATANVETDTAAATTADEDSDGDEDSPHNAVVAIGSDANLSADKSADAVVSVGGNASSAGKVKEAVVAVGGNATATGPVGEGVVAVFGDATLNSTAKTVVAVLGDVTLGPDARVAEQVVAVGGMIKRDAAAVVNGSEQTVGIGFGKAEGLRGWFKHCLMLARPLALDKSVSWAWGVAFVFLAFYALLAFAFRDGLQRCVTTMETQPGASVVTGLLSLVITPITFLLLLASVIGIVLIPVLGLGLFCASVFGKAVVLTWIGRRIYRGESHPVVPLLIGGIIVMALYVVPILGFVIYKALGILGLGIVIYTLLLTFRANRKRPDAPAAAAPLAAAPAGVDTTSSESVASAPFAAAAESYAAPDPAPAAAVLDYTLLPRAGFWPRMAALALDFFLVLIVVKLFIDHPRIGIDVGGHTMLLAMVAYGAAMWALKATTIGGSILGLKVVRLDGRPIDWGTAIARGLGCLLSLFVGGLGFIWILFDKDRQAWHDKIVGTVVVSVPKGVTLL
jgi:uncharacterized RDD family membrane protein YckC